MTVYVDVKQETVVYYYFYCQYFDLFSVLLFVWCSLPTFLSSILIRPLQSILIGFLNIKIKTICLRFYLHNIINLRLLDITVM